LKTRFPKYFGLLLWVAGFGAQHVQLWAQRSVTVQLDLTNRSQVRVAWQARSVVPAPGLAIFPDYQLHRSADLNNWVPAWERLAGNVGGTNRTYSILNDLGGDGMAFFRVESIVELPEADLIGDNLAEADFSGANLFGADLFAADLHGANLQGATLEGADLRFAVLTNADLSGASLFGAKALSADLSMAGLKDTDLRFANLMGPFCLAAVCGARTSVSAC